MDARTTHAPELDLFLAFAGRSGAIHESDGAGGCVVVLPEVVQRRFELPETMEVTADPDAARDDGSTLLCAGHPLVDAVAAAILASGDGGERWVAWPETSPRADQLCDAARTALPVDHGRVDLADQPRALYAPLLRVGVLVTYTVDERYQEREELWVDGRTGRHVGRIDDPLFTARRVPGRTVGAPDFARALEAAERLLARRTQRRLAQLHAGAAPRLQEETARARAYYGAALDALVRRRAVADPARRTQCDARIEATERERDRRLRELAEHVQPTCSWRPFRLHMVQCPAFEVPLVVRRGERTYPLTLTWLLPHATFAGVCCPGCGSEQPLVAGRTQLGCRACLPPPRVAEPEVSLVGRRVLPSQAAASDPAPPRAPQLPSPPPPSSQPLRAHTRPREAERLQQRREKERLKRAAAEQRAIRSRAGSRAADAGDLLWYQLWRACAMGRALPERSVIPHSPYAVLQRLYGGAAPLAAVGLPVSAVPDGTATGTATEWSETGGAITWGIVRAGGAESECFLRWRSGRSGPQAIELLPGEGLATLLDPSLGATATAATMPALFARAPVPHAALDAVEALVWEKELAGLGIPVVARCLATWSALRPFLEDEAPHVAAAALAAVATRLWRRPRTIAALSRDYGASPQVVRRAVKDLIWFIDGGRGGDQRVSRPVRQAQR